MTGGWEGGWVRGRGGGLGLGPGKYGNIHVRTIGHSTKIRETLISTYRNKCGVSGLLQGIVVEGLI